MAAHFTPLSVYLDNKEASARRAQQNSDAMGAVGSLAGILTGLYQQKKYNDSVKDFFGSLGDGEIQEGENTLADIDDQIKSIEDEIKALGGVI